VYKRPSLRSAAARIAADVAAEERKE